MNSATWELQLALLHKLSFAWPRKDIKYPQPKKQPLEQGKDDI